MLHPEAPIAAVIFDHDGTLVDSEPVHLDCWRQILLRHSCDLSLEDYANNLSGIPSIESAKWLISRFGLSLSPEQMYLDKRSILQTRLQHQAFPLMPGAAELISQIARSGTTMAVASGSNRPEVHRSIDYHRLRNHFKTVVTSEDAHNNKPAPDIYLYAAQQLHLAPEQCLAIEDSDSGEQAARAAGMRCLRLNTPSRLPAAANRLFMDNLDAVSAWLLPKLKPGQV